MAPISSIFYDANEFVIEGLLFFIIMLLVILAFCFILHTFITTIPIPISRAIPLTC